MIEDVPGFLDGVSSWLLSEGGWFFPLALLLTNITFKCFVNNRPDQTDFCQCIVTLPAEMKVIACSFVFAAVLNSASKPLEALSMQMVAVVFLLLLGLSIGVFNSCKASKATKIEGSVFKYVIVFALIGYFMLVASIDLMKYTVS